jgi:hypothetical protein
MAHAIDWAPLAPWVASGLGPVRWRHKLAQQWLLNFPHAAALGLWACALAPADDGQAAPPPSPSTQAGAWHALRLLHEHGHTELLAATLRQGLSVEAQDLTEQDPAWTTAWAAMLARLNATPERWLPTPLPKLTKALDALFASAQPLVLQTTGPLGERLILPPAAMKDALMVLMLGDTEAPYVGLAQLQAACRPESLAAWARELFELWAAEGMPPKGRFLLPVQGWLGDDATATRVHKGVVAWRAKLDRVRAYEGITALSRMGGKAALTWLAALADQKRYDDLRSRASTALQAAAEQRDMSMEELADCTLPELGFDAHSRQLLDFGPRQFELLLDEQLQVKLRELAPPVAPTAPPADPATQADAAPAKKTAKLSQAKPKKTANTWLKTLPKPRVADDAELAAQAKRQLKDVTTQLKALSRRQLQRMEAAMCSERRWTLASFRQNLVAHPIARVLTQRLVFGVYSALPLENKAASIDTPLKLFRVAEDGSAADAHDQPLDWDALAARSGDATSACLGLVHPLAVHAMPDGVSQLQAFASMLADYELLQPFEQLSRETADMPPAWLHSRELSDFAHRQLGTGSILGLMSLNWQRQVGDGGMVDGMYLALAPGLGVNFGFEPGWFVAGGVDTTEGQTVTGIHLAGTVSGPADAAKAAQAAGTTTAGDAAGTANAGDAAETTTPDDAAGATSAAETTRPATWADLSPIARSELMRSLNRLAWWQRA